MSSKTRIVQLPKGHGANHVVDHVSALRAAGHKIVLLTFQRTHRELSQLLTPGDDLLYVDASGLAPPGLAYGPDVLYIDSPGKLEEVIVNMRRGCKRMGNCHIVLDSLASLAAFNGEDVSVEFLHLFSSLVVDSGKSLDVLAPQSTPETLLLNIANRINATVTP